MDVRLDDDAMRGIITKAIVDSLTPERREALIAAAIKELLEKDSSASRYGSSKTKLQSIFDMAALDVAREVARDVMSKDEAIKEKIRQLFYEGWTKATGPEGCDKLIENIANSIHKGIVGERY